MVFDDLLTDTVSLIKTDGTNVEGIKASVQTSKIFIQGKKPLIESGDLIQRKMSNGAEETFEVIDPGFHEEFHSIPAGYQMRVRKLGIPEAKSAIQSITYNVTGHNARINQNSIDHSVNVVQLHPDVTDNLQALRTEIQRLIQDPSQRQEATEVVDAIEEQFNSGAPRKSVVQALVRGLPSAGSIASIGSFLVSLLG
ncbi:MULTISPECIES: hypothetical protein [unclassified Halomonas]|uniref:hypothetical protein n=1 Tax=unclassified Halomonas TaxID=2609666 RepID=UPI0009904B76|nr:MULTISPECIES: hypothetical protein [unclassified Halomonas]AQU82255.1 hypothetical protein B2G49_06380 [Halomonas sp. 'Soap Lake \